MKRLTKKFLVVILLLTSAISKGQTKAALSVWAGKSQSITLPVSTVTLSGSACNADGSVISSYLWTKISGSGGVISSGNKVKATVTGLLSGFYVFQLKVADNEGNQDSSTVGITVLPGTVNNSIPRAYAGNDQTITLPVS